MADILTIGEIVVEIMAKQIGQTFEETAEFVGPFASGAPAIFIDQVAKIGSSAGIISAIGNEGFGRLNLERLRQDGVDVSYIKVSHDLTTGVAFVTYKENGDRDFIFHLKSSAASLIGPDDVKKEDFERCKFFHIMGSSLFNESIRAAVKKAIELCKKTGTKISFDPNIRKELLQDSEMKEFLGYVLDNCNIFLPGKEELELLVDGEDDEARVQRLLSKGVEYIVVKRGSKGCKAYSKETSFSLEPIKVVEVDPTGAGDCFAGTLISCLNKGYGFRQSTMFANTAGALAVTKKGPMEGNSSLELAKEFVC
ncbi:sugar kinase [Neobacillus cucumis]|uniref:sugar kinase n=1 Tax=Neobacillus cucumis TaxID=1740721 RepID=UPI002040CC63|nr:sugar kinase [Neobacillus cucumis]MCM3729368.1 sugar kinase [Neobacillus cucumis]